MKQYNSNNPNPIDKAVGQKLRSIRSFNRMSQSDLADKLDITFQQVQKYENATNRISSSKIVEICKIFNITPNYLLDIEDDILGNIRDRDLKLVGKINKLNESQRLLINNTVNSLLKIESE